MVSVHTRVPLLLLSALCLLTLNTSEACCRKHSTMKLPFSAIRGWSLQTVKEHCNFSAIIFHTKRGRGCFNPALNWVMEYVDRMRNEAQKVHTRAAHS